MDLNNMDAYSWIKQETGGIKLCGLECYRWMHVNKIRGYE